MKEIIQRICELQPTYTLEDTAEMQERGRLIRHGMVDALRALSVPLSTALAQFGSDFKVGASDGIGRKTELPWVRFSSERMSPRPTEGFYCVLHFATDGSAVFIALGCGSSQFRNGSFVTLPDSELDKRTAWARGVVMEGAGTLGPFSDPPEYGARRKLPKSFERASAMAKRVSIGELASEDLEGLLVCAAELLKLIYQAELDGRELSPADLMELELERTIKPLASAKGGQGLGLSAADRKQVELRAMELVKDWLEREGYTAVDTSAARPYDFEATKDGDVTKVEVKGTTSDNPDAILMTHREVELHRSEKGRTALFIVSAIRLVPDGERRVAVGGQVEPLIDWNIDEWVLTSTAYRVGRP